MERYRELAGIYDYLVQGVDFEGWIDYIEKLLQKFNYKPRNVADLACGTGNTTFPFARRGYNVIGVDLSPQMINIAQEKAIQQNLDIKFLVQDIRELNLHHKMDLITCFHDGLNYLLNYEDIKLAFKKVYQNLIPDGLFIFDLNSVHWLANTDPETTVIEEEDLTLIWQSSYDRANDIWEINLTSFVRKNDLYSKFKEQHREKAYTPYEIELALKEAGLDLLGSYDSFTFEPIKTNSRRHFFATRKPK
ncbi:class I SAM-dependent DNA methyltransferase [Desulfolucanica intricata]|uniref:class I SAM-dependent DNA methyltransferase n=1 Tax=Desulfolucanica intricata TaxID=1285191 RepID=UPI000835A891|nr:class I SAM-dependent methyltransferase [Desulfolucanica intricata]